ncbi:MAG: peptide chain release factor N(5)-glutamine methyltransferase, partial [Eubacteriales bacterium]
TEAGIDPADARREARLLVSRFTGTPVSHLLAAPDEDFDETAVCCETGLTLAEAVEQRRTRRPLQYILGEWEFYGLRFAVNEHTLIPRPETERIAEAAIRLCPENGRVLDLCTGSGCIAAAILAHVPTARGVAVDLYPETLRMAEKNLTALGLSDRCTFVAGDAGTDLFDPSITFDVIVSNPPYVTAEEMQTLAPELSYEPPHALTDGGDGLSLLESIIEIYQNHLGPAGVLILEHGWQQADAVRSIAARSSLTPTPIPDYAGRTRGVILQK